MMCVGLKKVEINKENGGAKNFLKLISVVPCLFGSQEYIGMCQFCSKNEFCMVRNIHVPNLQIQSRLRPNCGCVCICATIASKNNKRFSRAHWDKFFSQVKMSQNLIKHISTNFLLLAPDLTNHFICSD